MTAEHVPPPVRLANEIAAQFRHRDPEQAAAAIAEHIRNFWEPRMIAQLRAASGGPDAALDPAAVDAVRLLP